MGTSSFNNDPGRTTGRTTGRLAIPSEKHHTSTAKVPRRFHRSENLSTFLATYSHNFTKKVQLLKKEGSSNVKSGPGTASNRCRGVLLKASSFDPWHCVGGWWILVEMTQLQDTSGLSASLRTSTVTERLTVYLIEVLFLCIVYFLLGFGDLWSISECQASEAGTGCIPLRSCLPAKHSSPLQPLHHRPQQRRRASATG